MCPTFGRRDARPLARGPLSCYAWIRIVSALCPTRPPTSTGERDDREGIRMGSAGRSPSPDAGASAQAADARSYYSISQAAALLGVSRMSIWRWIGAGRLPAARLGHRTTRIRREDLAQLLTER